MFSKFKDDKLKIVTIIAAVMIFVIGLVVTISNSGGTYATSASDYVCVTSGYEVVSDSDGNYYCCPSGYTLRTSIGGELYCRRGPFNFISEALAECDSPSFEGALLYYCDVPYQVALTYACYYCTGSNPGYQWSLGEPSSTCTGGSWSEVSKTQSECTNTITIKSEVGGTIKVEDITNSTSTIVSSGKSATLSFAYGVKIKITTIADMGYSLNTLKYGSTSTSSGSIFTVSGAETITATWKTMTYNISYNANGGSGVPSDQTKTYDVDLTLSSTKPTWSGHTFLSWNTKQDGSGTTYAAGGTYSSNVSTTLYAQWKEDSVTTYTVSYNANGGSGAPSAQTKTYGVNLTLSSTKPTWSGHTFLSWNTESDGSGTTYAAGGTYSANASTTLYAQWKEDSATTYTVSYDANGGSGAPSKQSGTTITISSTKPTMIGYTFVSWNTKKDGTGTTYTSGSSVTLTADVVLYAQYKANEYNISYTLNGGTVTGNPSTATYDSVVEIKNPTKDIAIYVYDNKNDATIGKINSDDTPILLSPEFDGWTSATINTSTAYHGTTLWSNGNIKVTDTTFLNLTPVNGATVTMVANWTSVDVTLPTVSKDGYTCKWNTKVDGTGTDYSSGGKYTSDSNSTSSVNLYAICDELTKVDEELEENLKTGDVLIVIAWLIGIGTLCYSVYYFRSRKVDM